MLHAGEGMSRILVIEDKDELRCELVDLLELEGFEVGADDYITKPFSPRKLVERINAVLGQGNSRQRIA